MCVRGVEVDYSTHSRWIQKYASELDKRCKPHLKPTNDSWRAYETYIKMKGSDRYLYRAVDSDGNTLDFLLTAQPDAEAAKWLLRKTMLAAHTQELDKNAAITQSYR